MWHATLDSFRKTAEVPSTPRLCSMVRDICDHFSRHGQNFTLETGQEPAEPAWLSSTTWQRNLKINFDPANLILYGMGDPVNALHTVGSRVVSVHCKDGVPPNNPVLLAVEQPLGSGEVDYPRFLHALKQIGYRAFSALSAKNPTSRRREEDIRHAVSFFGSNLLRCEVKVQSAIRRRSFLAGTAALPAVLAAAPIGAEAQAPRNPNQASGAYVSAWSALACKDRDSWRMPSRSPVSSVWPLPIFGTSGTRWRRKSPGNPNLFTTRMHEELLRRDDIDCALLRCRIIGTSVWLWMPAAAGKDIYCEKPMSHTIDQGFEMVDATQRNAGLCRSALNGSALALCAKAHELYKSGASATSRWSS